VPIADTKKSEPGERAMASGKRKKKSGKQTFVDFVHSPLVHRAAVGLVVVVIISIALAINPTPAGVSAGAPALKTYRATRTIQYVDEAATEAQRVAAEEAVAPIYLQNLQAGSTARAEVSDFFGTVASLQEQERSSETTLSDAEIQILVAEGLEDIYGDVLSDDVLAMAAGLDASALAAIDTQTRELITLMLNDMILEDDLDDAKAELATSADLLALPREQRQLVSAVGQAYLQPTLILDEVATALEKDDARDSVEDVIISKQAGENIVQQGQIVTAQHVEILKLMGVFDSSTDWPAILASVALLMAMVVGSGMYLAFYEEPVWDRLLDVFMIATLLMASVLMARVVLWFVPDISLYVIPLPFVAMLITLLINPRVGFLAAVMTTVACSLVGLSSGVYLVAVLILDLIAIALLSRMKQRSHLFWAGAAVTLVAGVIAFGATLASSSSLSNAYTNGAYGLLGGLLATVLTYGLLPFLEVVFRVTTDVRLLELANPSHPLMRELMLNAPGTYNHSILTANLAEAAAEEIGANGLLARVGAYYHDVGKTKRPMFFVENQPHGENPHDNTSPTLSKLVITAHVKEGLELARKHKLPPEVLEIIAQHHGNSLVTYFYAKANEAGQKLPEEEFRYPGEPPRSAEAALVMLADSCEAGVRAITKPTVHKIENMVRKIVKAKLDDGQLDHCALTLMDIERIVKVFAKMLTGIYHRRIEYPELAKNGKSRPSEGS